MKGTKKSIQKNKNKIRKHTYSIPAQTENRFIIVDGTLFESLHCVHQYYRRIKRREVLEATGKSQRRISCDNETEMNNYMYRPVQLNRSNRNCK